MGKIIGLDLGITSVGYAVINGDYSIETYGVRLFEEASADNNLKRRTMRGSRRLKSRRQNRVAALKYLLKQNGIMGDNASQLNNVYEIRCKGLHEKLTNEELSAALLHIAKRRGSSLEVAVDDENKEDVESSSSLSNNTKELRNRGLYVCELQLERLNKGIKLRNHQNIFKTDDYIAEVRQILSNQGLDDDLNEKIIDIISRRRQFSEGPGSEKFPTPYGSYRMVLVDGKYVLKHVNLIDEMRGKCSIFKNEPRIAKWTYKACLFNLLNDLNNLTIDRDGVKEKLTTEQKKYLIEEHVNKKGSLTVNNVVKYLNTTLENISGFRIDKSEKPIITKFDGYSKIIKISKDLSFEQIDTIIDILTKTLVVEERIREISSLGYPLDDIQIDALANLTKINGYHSLSAKAMDVLIPELLNTSMNQMEIITKLGLNKVDEEKFATKEIPFDEEAILSPVAKRVHRQAIKVVNELIKEYDDIDYIIIETTRSKNSADERKRINDMQARFEQDKERTNQILRDLDKNPDKYNTLTKLKLRLYMEQQGKSMYSGDPIDLDLLLNDPTAYEIEHIIPYAVSFDNTLNNKCIVSKSENQLKGKRTPWAYFASGKAIGTNNTFEKFTAFVNTLNISKHKKEKLLDQSDVSKYENMEKFTERNLVDTSYGIRTVMNTMQNYFKAVGLAIKVRTVNGKMTSTFRGIAQLEKLRDYYIHHAVDALIIAGFGVQGTIRLVLDKQYSNNKTIELPNDPLEDSSFLRYVRSLKDIQGDPYHFSYKVDTKTNRQISDETIYSTRTYDDGEYVIKKYKDIYGKEGESLAKLFKDGKSDKLLMYRNDIETYNLFKKIYESYPNEKNPFAAYKKEFGVIRKYSKKGNGPEITSVKYADSKLGNHLDITSHYDAHNKKVVLLQITPYRTDFYQDKDGKYKFLTIRRYHIKQVNGENVIDEALYNEQMEKKGISKDDKFLFTLNRNSILSIKYKDQDEHLYRFVATNADELNRIEVKEICETGNRNMLTIGSKIEKITKYNVSILGKYQKVQHEALKLRWK